MPLVRQCQIEIIPKTPTQGIKINTASVTEGAYRRQQDLKNRGLH